MTLHHPHHHQQQHHQHHRFNLPKGIFSNFRIIPAGEDGRQFRSFFP
jgi:hypothetical protein